METRIEKLSQIIAGEIVMSGESYKTLKKWREFFGISQTELAKQMNIFSSVICDYEKGRRKSPGIEFIKRVISALIEIDKKTGTNKIYSLERISEKNMAPGAVLDMREFEESISISRLCDELKAKIYSGEDLVNKNIYGYTIIDSINAITDLSSDQLIKLFGQTAERCLIFTNVRSGRSAMIALKTAQGLGAIFKPALVVFHTNNKPDDVAVNIAKQENIILCTAKAKDSFEIQNKLAKFR